MTDSYVADWVRSMSATCLFSLRNRHSPMDYILHEQRKIGSIVGMRIPQMVLGSSHFATAKEIS